MNEIPLESTPERRKLWVRALMMVLFAVAFQLAAWVLICVALVQLLLSLVGDGPNERLREFGGSIGGYLSHIAQFVSFRTEEPPFPLSDWPGRS